MKEVSARELLRRLVSVRREQWEAQPPLEEQGEAAYKEWAYRMSDLWDEAIAFLVAEPAAIGAFPSGETTVNPASKASEPGEQTSAVSSPAAAPAVLQTADGVPPSDGGQPK